MDGEFISFIQFSSQQQLEKSLRFPQWNSLDWIILDTRTIQNEEE